MSLTVRCRFQRRGRGSFLLDADLTVPGTGVTTLWGPSGCGKTTLLRCIAGLEDQVDGRIQLAGKVWLDTDAGIDVPPHRRTLGCVFQDGLLFPHLDVRANLLFGRRRRNPPAGEEDVERAVRLLGLDGMLDRLPDTLSGGERQRVALGRALLARPDLLLLDEPLASVDAAAREDLYPFIAAVARREDIPILHVTHDRREAAALADHLVLMSGGRIAAAGPLDAMAADLDGPWAQGPDPVAVIDGRISDRDQAFHLNRLEFSGGCLWLPGPALAAGAKQRVLIAARDVSLSLDEPRVTSILNVLPAVVTGVRDRNESQVLVGLAAGDTSLLAVVTRRSAANLDLEPGRRLQAQVKSAALV
ncbi:molybdenum ABC transporter ATP-binding protein [bacterium]|nr:molybdenum ABC transporter ATP-binding protein [bacterium]